ncbi:hypothetical protein Tco_0000798 [Tanacetum coccineum]
MRKGRAKVAWEVVCLPKSEGGLGIRRLEAFNQALISSHIWCILSLKESLWVKWIHMYKLRGRSLWEIPLRGHMSWGWRKILQVRSLVRQFIWYRVGDGSMISTWFDNWCPISPLSLVIPNRDIYEAGLQLSFKVSDVILNGHWTWPNDWFTKFPVLSTIAIPNLVSYASDGLFWKNSNNVDSRFSVALAWDSIRPRGTSVDWYHLVWFSQHIPRHAIHLWLVIKRKLKTQDSLRQWDVWDGMKPLIRMPNIPSSLSLIVEFLISLANKRSARSVIAKLVFAASCYFVWQERKNRLFLKQKRTSDLVLNVIMSTVRLKLLSCKFRKSKNIQMLLHLWKLPDFLLNH